MRELAERDHRVAQHQKIGTAAHAVDGVRRAGVSGIEMRAGRGCQVPPGREAHDANAVRQHAEVGGLVADCADGALRVAQFHRVVIFRSQPVFQHEGRDADGIQPARHLVAFLIHRKVRIAAAGTHDHGGAGPTALRHNIGRERGLVFVLSALGAGRSAGPQRVGFRHVGRRLGKQGGRHQD